MAKVDGWHDFVSPKAQAMRQAQPFYEARCIANKRNAVDMSFG
jgi:hypothetical protein